MATLALLILSLLIFLMLLHLNGLLALLFVLARRSSPFLQSSSSGVRWQSVPICQGTTTPSPRYEASCGWRRSSAPTTGIALGVLWILFAGVLAVFLSRHVFHVH